MELCRPYFFFICILSHFRTTVFGGKFTEERLAQRMKDLDLELDKDGRPRRQLPTEINIQVTAPLFTARLYDFGPTEGDKTIPPAVDVGIKVTLQVPLTFFEKKYSDIYILSNGAIGFDQNSRNYKNNVLNSADGSALIAPLWNRNDLRKGGQIYYREVTDGRIVERAQSEVRYQYDKNIKPFSVLLVTWVNMQPVGDETVKQDNTNTIQAAIITSENGTFANFIYKNIGWSQSAEAGFSKGDGQSYYAMPSSGTEGITFLKDFGNTGIPGEWMFEIDKSKLIRCKQGIKGDTCDNECSESEWGYDCESCCHCGKGRCHAITGECTSGICKQCWNGPPMCNTRDAECRSNVAKECGFNAISFTDNDKCGESVLRCQCLAGYSGDGYNCSDIDECTKKNVCNENAHCFNTPGRFYCECKVGYTGNGTNCVIIPDFQQHQTEFVPTTFFPNPTETVTQNFEAEKPTATPVRKQTDLPERTNAQVQPQEVAHLLPKEKNSILRYTLKQPLTVFGKLRTKFTVSSSGVVALDDVERVNPDQDLELTGIRGFAPFFGRIDLRKSPGRIYIAETTQSVILTDATNTVEQHFHNPGFLAKSVVTVTFENVTAENSQKSNTFQAIFISGNNAAGENVTYVEYVYADLQWSDDAQAIILTDDATNTIVLPGSGTDGVKQLSRLSNIRIPGEWMYRVDSNRISLCPTSNLLPPYCDTESPAGPPVFPAEFTSEIIKTIKSHPKIDFEDRNGEIVSFPSFITVVPQLVTGDEPLDAEAATPLLIRPSLISAQPPLPFKPSSQRPSIISVQNANHGKSEIHNASGVGQQPPRLPSSTTLAINLTNSHEIGNNDVKSLASPSSGDEQAKDQTAPVLRIFTTTKKPTRPPTAPPTRPHPKLVTGGNNVPPTNRGIDDSKKQQQPPPANSGGAEDQEGLSSPNKLAIIIPSAIVGVWLLLLFIITIVVCCRRRKYRKRMRSKYDPSSAYHFRHMAQSPVNATMRSKETSTPTASNPPAGGGGGFPPPPPPHATYEDHLEKAARLSEMAPYGGQNGRASMYGSYWNVPNSSSANRQPFSYYNQGYYDSCPEFNNRFNYSGRY